MNNNVKRLIATILVISVLLIPFTALAENEDPHIRNGMITLKITK